MISVFIKFTLSYFKTEISVSVGFFAQRYNWPFTKKQRY